MSKSLASLALSIGATAVLCAQTPSPLAAQADMVRLQSAMVTAQAAAVRTGDEGLPCEALSKEMVSTMSDPAIQSYAARTNAAYAKELASTQKKGVMAPEAAAALAAALAPGAGMAAMPAMPQVAPAQSMTPQQVQQMVAAQQQASVAYMNQLMPIMPALMRLQRVTMLAVTKGCPWATGGLGLYPGIGVPGAVPPAARTPR